MVSWTGSHIVNQRIRSGVIVLSTVLAILGCSVRTEVKRLESKLHTAILSGETASDIEAMARQEPALLQVEEESSGTPLTFAVLRGRSDVVGALLRAGANANVVVSSGTFQGWSALGLAVTHNDVEAVRSLLSHGADPDAVDRYGVTVWQHAEKSTVPEIRRLLSQTGRSDPVGGTGATTAATPP